MQFHFPPSIWASEIPFCRFLKAYFCAVLIRQFHDYCHSDIYTVLQGVNEILPVIFDISWPTLLQFGTRYGHVMPFAVYGFMKIGDVGLIELKDFRILYTCISVGWIWAQTECTNRHFLSVGLERALLYLVSCTHLLFNFKIISTGALHDVAESLWVSRKLVQGRSQFVAGLNAITSTLCNGMADSKKRLSEVWVLRHEMSGYYVTK